MKKNQLILKKYGLFPSHKYLDEIRQLLLDEILYSTPEGDANDSLLILSIMLYYIGNIEDCELIWRAKMINFNTGRLIEIGLVCVSGYDETLQYASSKPHLHKLKMFLEMTSHNEFRKEVILSNYKNHFGLEEDYD